MKLKPHKPHRYIVTKPVIILISKAASKTGCIDGVWNIKKCTYMCTINALKWL
jgi:hypothetical protein